MTDQTLPPANIGIGRGDWEAFQEPMEKVRSIAAEWAKQLQGVEKPWLCWHVNDRWSKIQQRLVQHAGWTPVIGWDPRAGRPDAAALPGSVVIDFNKGFDYPLMYMHFPLGLSFLFADLLAFWHSDLLCRLEVMEYMAHVFESMKDGEMAAILDKGGRRHLFSFKRHRYWELAGCTTRGASEDQFRHGCGWWQHMQFHPNCPGPGERKRRSAYYWDHGVGIMYWKKKYGGVVHTLDRARVEEGHCTSLNRPDYKRVAPKSSKALYQELDMNFSLEEEVKRLGISHLLD